LVLSLHLDLNSLLRQRIVGILNIFLVSFQYMISSFDFKLMLTRLYIQLTTTFIRHTIPILGRFVWF
jgi:hypothetical protein